MKKLLALLALGVALTGCASSSKDTVKIGVVGENNEALDEVARLAKEEGINIELVNFSDYTLPNLALNDGEIDLNAFQHYAYLDNEVATKGYDITAIGDTVFGPMALYSNNLDSLEGISADAKVLIPNDLTNGGRALKLLEAAGLLAIDPAVGYSPELGDITANPHNLQISEVDASLIPSLLSDVAIGVINNNYAYDNSLSLESALYVEQATQGNPYINIIAARLDDKDNETYLKIVELYQSDAVKQVILDTYEGYQIPAWN
ncbi:MAG: MetQ/NlpA family ABC transporter substrate-binding protein [Erysipelotrichaceae bacterium]|nr:MetQ/NlpA family ABC transporter substrate-binding protein [Erysipelotrichaceae bacterium]